MGYGHGAFMRARTIIPSGKGTVSSAQKQASFAKNLKYFFNSVFNNFFLRERRPFIIFVKTLNQSSNGREFGR